MAITTYSELQSAIASWLSRDDLTVLIPDFITLFEAAVARKLNVRSQETSTTLTPSGGTATLPTGYLGFKAVTWQGSPLVGLTYATPAWIKLAFPSAPQGTPRFFTIEGQSLKVMPTSDTNIELLYYAKNAAVSGTLNWLFTNYPDAYLFGSLCEAYMMDKDEERAAIWKARRDGVLDEVVKLNFREPSGLEIRTDGPIV